MNTEAVGAEHQPLLRSIYEEFEVSVRGLFLFSSCRSLPTCLLAFGCFLQCHLEP